MPSPCGRLAATVVTTVLSPLQRSVAFAFFQPLQGLWTLLIYMQPDIIKKKRSSDGNMSWLRAFADTLWSAILGRRGRNRASQRTSKNATAPRTSATAESSHRLSDGARVEAMVLKMEDLEEDPEEEDPEEEDPEEGKSEVQEDEPSV